MANGNPTAVGGFLKGFQGGLQLGGEIKERRLKTQELGQKKTEIEMTKAKSAILNIDKKLKGKNLGAIRRN